MGNTRNIGLLAENLAVMYLKKYGFTIITRNCRICRGEIDIVAGKSGMLHFIEVKSTRSVTDRPEEKVDGLKLMRIRSAIGGYLSMINSEAIEFKFHVIVVRLGQEGEGARISVIRDVIV